MKTLKSILVTLLLVIVLVACSRAQEPSNDGAETLPNEGEHPIDDGGLVAGIENTAWQLLAIRDFDALLAADADNPAIIELKEDGTFHITTGCGEQGGTYTLDGETIAFEVMMTTAVVACTEYQVEQALAVENLMQNATRYSVEGETLTIAIDGDNDATFGSLQIIDDDGLMPTIANTAWELLAIRDFDALLAADADNPAIIELKEDGTFHITTGCGEQGGTYTLDGEAIAFEVMMTTAVVGCTEYQVEQALAVENLMQNATRYSIEGETLTIAIDGEHDAKFSLQLEGN